MAAIHSRFRITDGRRFRLKQISPGDTAGLDSKDETADRLARGLESLRDQQEKLYAQGTWALLVIIQAMDAAGKDSTIEHVMSGVNPQGCQVSSFKAPSSEELEHDFLWRTTTRLPRRGITGVFNRSGGLRYDPVAPDAGGADRFDPAWRHRHRVEFIETIWPPVCSPQHGCRGCTRARAAGSVRLVNVPVCA